MALVCSTSIDWSEWSVATILRCYEPHLHPGGFRAEEAFLLQERVQPKATAGVKSKIWRQTGQEAVVDVLF